MNARARIVSAAAILLSVSVADAHTNHAAEDSLTEQAMGDVIVEYHRLLAAADSTAYQLLAPAYSSFEMHGRLDPTRWWSGALLPQDLHDGWPDGDRPEAYENEVTVVHVHTRWNRGIVITHEAGSFRGDSWEAHNAWLVMRVGDEWRIGASIHQLPEAMVAELHAE